MLVSVFATLTLQAQIVHTDDVEIEKSGDAKLDMTDTGNNRTWQLVSGLAGFQIGYLTGNLIGTNAPFQINDTGLVRIGVATIDTNAALTVGGNLALRGDLKLDTGFGITVNGTPFAAASGTHNTFLGLSAGAANTGIRNTFLGFKAGQTNTSGQRNVFIGYHAGQLNTTGLQNVFLGSRGGMNNTTGSNNMFIGYQSGLENTSGGANTYIGGSAGRNGSTTSDNVAIGNMAGFNNNSTEGRNTIIGIQAGRENANGGANVNIGYKAGYGYEGSRNVFLGVSAGGANAATGSDNVFIGNQAGIEETNASNKLYIANRANSQREALIYGEFDNGKVGINTTDLDANSALTVGGGLSLDGDLRLDTNFGIKMDNAPFISRIGSSLVMGVNAGNLAMTGASNVFVGPLSGQSNTSGNRNAYFGEGAGSANTRGFRNVYLGAQSGNSSTLGAENTFVGYQSGYEAEGSRNTFLGGMAGRYTVNGTANTSIGYGAGSNSSSTTGENTFVGAYAGEHGINSKKSVAIGFRAGSDVDGEKNVLIGYQAGSGDTNASNSLYIGNTTYDAAGGVLIYGRFDQGKVGINTRNLDANSALTVNGEVTATKYSIAGGGDLVSSPWSTNATDITFQTGDVAIGTATPGAKLHVNGNIYMPLQKSFGYNPEGDKFTYEGSDIGHYTLGWYNVPGSAEARLSGYGGIKLFTKSTPRMSISEDGQVDIGGDVTKTTLRLEATDEAGAPAAAVGLELHGYEGRAKGIFISDKNNSNKWFVGEGYNYEGIGIGYSSTTQMEYATNAKFFINKDGEVGIGTITPSAKLDVNGNAVFHGKIESTKVKVSTTPQGGWPDYVFEPEFKLRPLSEVEAFVKDNKHLPEVPSAKEVEANGIDLGNMDATLLKKVEELTLYMIEMNKKIEKLEEENKQLKELVKKDK